jgi:hypothetical protein
MKFHPDGLAAFAELAAQHPNAQSIQIWDNVILVSVLLKPFGGDTVVYAFVPGETLRAIKGMKYRLVPVEDQSDD